MAAARRGPRHGRSWGPGEAEGRRLGAGSGGGELARLQEGSGRGPAGRGAVSLRDGRGHSPRPGRDSPLRLAQGDPSGSGVGRGRGRWCSVSRVPPPSSIQLRGSPGGRCHTWAPGPVGAAAGPGFGTFPDIVAAPGLPGRSGGLGQSWPRGQEERKSPAEERKGVSGVRQGPCQRSAGRCRAAARSQPRGPLRLAPLGSARLVTAGRRHPWAGRSRGPWRSARRPAPSPLGGCPSASKAPTFPRPGRPRPCGGAGQGSASSGPSAGGRRRPSARPVSGVQSPQGPLHELGQARAPADPRVARQAGGRGVSPSAGPAKAHSCGHGPAAPLGTFVKKRSPGLCNGDSSGPCRERAGA